MFRFFKIIIIITIIIIIIIIILCLYYFCLIFIIILIFCQGSGWFREDSVGFCWFRLGSGWVPGGSGRFWVGSAFYIHPACFNCVARSSLPYVCRFRVGRSCPIKGKDNCFISYSCAFVM